MSEPERDTAPTPSGEIVGKSEARPASGERDTDLSVLDGAGGDPDTLMSLPKPEAAGSHTLEGRGPNTLIAPSAIPQRTPSMFVSGS